MRNSSIDWAIGTTPDTCTAAYASGCAGMPVEHHAQAAATRWVRSAVARTKLLSRAGKGNGSSSLRPGQRAGTGGVPGDQVLDGVAGERGTGPGGEQRTDWSACCPASHAARTPPLPANYPAQRACPCGSELSAAWDWKQRIIGGSRSSQRIGSRDGRR